MIVLALFDETDDRTGKKTGRQLVSHGIDIATLRDVTLPCESPASMGWFNKDMQEWILKD